MTKELSPVTQAAAAALEAALNHVKNDEAVDVASMLIMLSTGFMRAVCGDEYVRGFLEEGLRDLDKPPIVQIIPVRKKSTQH